MIRNLSLTVSIALLTFSLLKAQGTETKTVLIPDKIFDGYSIHQDWVVLVNGNTIEYVGKFNSNLEGSKKRLPGITLLPGLIEGHSHILLHPYNETTWNDQVLKESQAERVARGVVHLEKSLMSGITLMRDLGSEGAGYADVGLKAAVNKGVIPGPRLLVAGPAIVATGSYGPKGFHETVEVPLGAEEADGIDNLTKVVRTQIGHGADIIKVYADYRWGLNKEARPTFTQKELNLIVEIANSSGRDVVAHAASKEGMRRAILAGVRTIEHGDEGDEEIFNLMKEHGVALCPTIAAGEAISIYRGWRKGETPLPARIIKKKQSFELALRAGVEIVAGGDVGVFPHGDNVREFELMVEYGMDPLHVLQAATSGNSKIFNMDKKTGILKEGLWADIIGIESTQEIDISTLRNIRFVMKNGIIYKDLTK